MYRWISKVNYQEHSLFHLCFFRHSFENCLCVLSAALLLLHIASCLRWKYKEYGNKSHQDTAQSHLQGSLFCTFFMCSENRAVQASQMQIFLPLNQWDAKMVRLRGSKGLTTLCGIVLFIAILRTSHQLWCTSGFQGSSLIKLCAATTQLMPFTDGPQERPVRGKLILCHFFSSRKGWKEIHSVVTYDKTSWAGRKHRKPFTWEGSNISRKLAVSRYSCLYLPGLSHLQKKQQKKIGTEKEATTAAELRFKHSKISNFYSCITCSPGTIFLRLYSRVRRCC